MTELYAESPEDFRSILSSALRSGEDVTVTAVSRQRKYGGGKFKSEDQRRYMWSQCPKAARKWARNMKTRPSDWRGCRIQTRPGI